MVTETFFTVINERKIIKKLDSQEEIFQVILTISPYICTKKNLCVSI